MGAGEARQRVRRAEGTPGRAYAGQSVPRAERAPGRAYAGQSICRQLCSHLLTPRAKAKGITADLLLKGNKLPSANYFFLPPIGLGRLAAGLPWLLVNQCQPLPIKGEQKGSRFSTSQGSTAPCANAQAASWLRPTHSMHVRITLHKTPKAFAILHLHWHPIRKVTVHMTIHCWQCWARLASTTRKQLAANFHLPSYAAEYRAFLCIARGRLASSCDKVSSPYL